MSTPSFKNLTQDDFTATTTMLNERIPLTGTLVSGSAKYGVSSGRAINIKTFSHNMFQSVYDYPYLSSSANHIFDITAGFSAFGTGSVSGSATVDTSKKVNVYNQMAQVLVGYDVSGNVRRFDPDGNFAGPDTAKMENAIFLNFSRLLVKDEIKKGSFSLSIGDGTTYLTPFSTKSTITDASSSTNYRNNSPAGEYGFLKYTAEAATATLMTDSATSIVGKTLILTNADGTTHQINCAAAATSKTNINSGNCGSANAFATELNTVLDLAIAAGDLKCTAADVSNTTSGGTQLRINTLTQTTTGTTGNKSITGTMISSNKIIVNNTAVGGAHGTQAFIGGNSPDTVGLIYYQAGIVALTSSAFGASSQILNNATASHDDVLKKQTITAIADGVRHRIDNITFDNVTELNSSIYFCRINHNDFNYSSNPTYLSESKIVVKTDSSVVNEANLSPITYITTVGLYSTNNELMAVAKLSEPLKKTPDNEFTLRVRLDY